MKKRLKKGDVVKAEIRCRSREFPLDMLRYDFCSFDEQDPQLERARKPTDRNESERRDGFTVLVKKVVTDPKADQWTFKRWESFSCEIREFE